MAGDVGLGRARRLLGHSYYLITRSFWIGREIGPTSRSPLRMLNDWYNSRQAAQRRTSGPSCPYLILPNLLTIVERQDYPRT